MQAVADAGLEVSLFGKLPARPDFVRARCAGPAAAELDQWLVRAVEQLRAGHALQPAQTLRYVFCPARAQNALVGVLGASRDQVGREFPLTLFCTLPLAGARLPAIALGYESFFVSAEQTLTELQATRFEDIDARLSALRAPDPSVLLSAGAQCQQTLETTAALEFAERVFGPAQRGLHCYGFLTFATAAGPVRSAAPAQSATVLECPVRTGVDRLAWLELASRMLRWRDALASCFWTDTPNPRLLVSLGPPPADLLRAIAEPSYSSARVWPLTTERQEAIDRARSTLPQLASLGSAPLTADRMLSLAVDAAG